MKILSRENEKKSENGANRKSNRDIAEAAAAAAVAAAQEWTIRRRRQHRLMDMIRSW